MTEPIQHDPRLKLQIKDAIYEFLYQSVLDNLRKRLHSLISRNSSLINSTNSSFSYKGVVYSVPGSIHTPKIDRLHIQLHNEMNEYVKECTLLNSQELPFVMGFINQVLNATSELQDHLRVFPASVHQPIEQLIATCPCRTSKLSEFVVLELQEKNKVSIDLMKQRLVKNLLI